MVVTLSIQKEGQMLSVAEKENVRCKSKEQHISLTKLVLKDWMKKKESRELENSLMNLRLKRED